MGLFDSISSAVGDVVDAVSDIPTGLFTAGASLLGGQQANSASAASVAQQEAFQDQESSTAYQRGTKDMIAAGLNPMLAYSQGGASTPSGSSYTAQDIVTPAMKSYNDSTSTSASSALMKTQAAQSITQSDLNEALTEKARADADLSRTNAAATAAGLPEKQLRGRVFSNANSAVNSSVDSSTAQDIRNLFDPSDTGDTRPFSDRFSDAVGHLYPVQ